MNTVVRLLAAYRLTRLVVADEITKDARRAIQKRVPEKVAYLLGCPWCASMYLAPLISGAHVLWPNSRLVRAGTEALAGSAVAGLIATWLHVEEETGELLEDATDDGPNPAPGHDDAYPDERIGGWSVPTWSARP